MHVKADCQCECKGEEHDPVLCRIRSMYRDLLLHDGFGELQVGVKILKRGQKEVIVKSGKEYRYVVDVPGELQKWE
ncbi:MAG: hypothetical protein LBQ66_16205 [Planctomycetaceae bacterium]|nr:hypothetical protein [Planctomycetaceae bacterium]